MTLPKILCVDDQPINIQILYQIFSDDHEMFMATNGKDALEVCARVVPDLVLLDVMMPDIDGFAVCRLLKQNPATANIPVIFVTAQHDPETETAGLATGAVDFITRPFNASVVRARVHTHIQLHHLKENLEQLVKVRTNELELAQQRLHESMEQLTISEAKATVSTLIASVSHELNSPIGNSVMAATSFHDVATQFRDKFESGMIRRSDVSNFLEELIEMARLIHRNLTRAAELLSNFRQVSADQASEQRRRFDLGETVREVIESLRPSLKRQPHRIELDIPPNIILDSQPGSLGQIIINIINNAYLHAFEDRTDGLLVIRAEQIGSQVMISFTDNGTGIPPEHLGKILEPYFSTKIGAGGTGLGMAIVNNLVTKSLKGTIQIESRLGVGTRFEITVPLVLPTKKTV